MKLVIILISIFHFNFLFAQKDLWQYGQVTLDDGRVMKGEMRFSPLLSEGLLLVKRKNNRTVSLAPSQVLFFTLSERETERKRKYYSLPLTDKYTNYTREYFLEVLYESRHIALLSRDFLAPKDIKNYGHFRNYGGVVKVKDRNTIRTNVLYLIEPEESELKVIKYEAERENHISLLNGGFDRDWKVERKVIYSFFGDYEADMRDYIQEHRLNFRKKEDLIMALKYFSELKG